MAFEIEKMANKLGGNGNGFEMERISEAVENGAGGSGGSDGGILFATIDGTTMTFDKTWKQIHDATFAVATLINPSGHKTWGYISVAVGEEDTYIVTLFTGTVDGGVDFVTDSEDGYPVMA